MTDAGQYRRIGDLVAIEVKDRQDHAVAHGVEKLVAVPAGRQRAGLGFAIADDASDEQIRIIESRAIGMAEAVAEFATFVDGAGRLGSDMAGDAAGEGELREE